METFYKGAGHLLVMFEDVIQVCNIFSHFINPSVLYVGFFGTNDHFFWLGSYQMEDVLPPASSNHYEH